MSAIGPSPSRLDGSRDETKTRDAPRFNMERMRNQKDVEWQCKCSPPVDDIERKNEKAVIYP